MSVRREKRRDPTTGAVRKYWIVDISFEHPDGRRERVRKVPPVQTRRGAERYEREVRAALLAERGEAELRARLHRLRALTAVRVEGAAS